MRDVQVRGAVWYQVPHLGHVAGAFTGQRKAIGAIAAALLLGYDGLTPRAGLAGPAGGPDRPELARRAGDGGGR